jgi:hypothetical protein
MLKRILGSVHKNPEATLQKDYIPITERQCYPTTIQKNKGACQQKHNPKTNHFICIDFLFRQRLNDASKTDALTFRLDLGVGDGQLTAAVSNAQLDGIQVEQNRLDHWNQAIASRLVILGKNSPSGSLQPVSVTPEAAQMTWNVSR